MNLPEICHYCRRKAVQWRARRVRVEDYQVNRPVRSSTKIVGRKLFEGHCDACHSGPSGSTGGGYPRVGWSGLMTREEALVFEVMEG